MSYTTMKQKKLPPPLWGRPGDDHSRNNRDGNINFNCSGIGSRIRLVPNRNNKSSNNNVRDKWRTHET